MRPGAQSTSRGAPSTTGAHHKGANDGRIWFDSGKSPSSAREDPGLLTGANHYVDDLDIDAAQMVFVRSSEAHAEITSIDTSEAESMPGVLAVYTADSLPMERFPGFPDD